MREQVSRQVVDQRIRNRYIEYFELASSEAELLDYQAKVPVNIFAELINQWEDWSPRPGLTPMRTWFPLTVYSEEEIVEILRFHTVWDAVSDSTPQDIDRIEDFFVLPQWQLLKSAAVVALATFSKRGKLSEDEEDTG